jgi:hypothetical protein
MAVHLNESAVMKLQATVVVGLKNAPKHYAPETSIRVAVKYYPTSTASAGHTQPLWTESLDLHAGNGWKGSLTLYRLRPGQARSLVR